MSQTDDMLRRLQEAFEAGLPGGAPPEEAAERIWDAARGDLSPDETREVLAQVVADPVLARAWIAARRILEGPGAGETGAGERPDTAVREGRGRRGLAAAAAALIAVTGLGTWFLLREPAPPVYRGDPDAVRSLVPEGTPLPRDQVRLRWGAGPPGTVYRLWVYREDFTLVFAADEVHEASFLVPREVLEEVPDGETLQWQVDSLLPEGERARSAPHRIRLEAASNSHPREGKER